MHLRLDRFPLPPFTGPHLRQRIIVSRMSILFSSFCTSFATTHRTVSPRFVRAIPYRSGTCIRPFDRPCLCLCDFPMPLRHFAQSMCPTLSAFYRSIYILHNPRVCIDFICSEMQTGQFCEKKATSLRCNRNGPFFFLVLCLGNRLDATHAKRDGFMLLDWVGMMSRTRKLRAWYGDCLPAELSDLATNGTFVSP